MLSHLVNGFCWNRPHGSSLSLCFVCYKRVCLKAEQIKACLTWLSLVHALPMHMVEVWGSHSFSFEYSRIKVRFCSCWFCCYCWGGRRVPSLQQLVSVPFHENECTERQVPLLPGGKTTVSWRHSACSVHLSHLNSWPQGGDLSLSSVWLFQTDRPMLCFWIQPAVYATKKKPGYWFSITFMMVRTGNLT